MAQCGLDLIDVFYKTNEPLKNYTTFKVGGKAKYMFFPSTFAELNRVIEFSKGNYFVLGLGSNVLVSDDGFDGVVINTKFLNKIKLMGNILVGQSGARLSDIVKVCADNALGGMEFCVGIPGTLGGLVAQNGGCFNKSIGDLVCYVKSANGVFNNKDCQFGYRESRFFSDAIFEVAIKLHSSESEIIEQKAKHYISARKSKQPKGNSCGSVFLNEGFFAGKVIDQAGLKGYSVGGASISKEHANFIINNGSSAKDIFELIKQVKEIVYRKTEIVLHEEVRYIGKFE